jgi:8-oxo-dGTP diphosphatase
LLTQRWSFGRDNMEDQNRPKVGIGVMILKDGKVLVAKRKGSHGEDEYAFPGGHLEHMETFEECARRETREEAGIEIKNIRFNTLTNLRRYSPKHYADIGLIAEWESGEPQNLEPNKTSPWMWLDPENIPLPHFGATDNYLKAYRGEGFYFDD